VGSNGAEGTGNKSAAQGLTHRSKLLGDLAAVGILLKQVSALGKLTRNGWGTIHGVHSCPR